MSRTSHHVANLLEVAQRQQTRWDWSGAAETLRRALRAAREAGLTDGIQLLSAQRMLADVLRELGDLPEAQRLAMALVPQCEDVLGSTHPATVRARAVLARVLHDLGDLDSAYDLCRQVLDYDKGTSGPAARAVLLTQANLARLQRDRGERDAALTLLQTVHGTFRRRYGDEDLDTLRMAADLAELHLAVQDGVDDRLAARQLLTRAHHRARATLGGGHPFTVRLEQRLIEVEPPMPSNPEPEEEERPRRWGRGKRMGSVVRRLWPEIPATRAEPDVAAEPGAAPDVASGRDAVPDVVPGPGVAPEVSSGPDAVPLAPGLDAVPEAAEGLDAVPEAAERLDAVPESLAGFDAVAEVAADPDAARGDAGGAQAVPDDADGEPATPRTGQAEPMARSGQPAERPWLSPPPPTGPPVIAAPLATVAPATVAPANAARRRSSTAAPAPATVASAPATVASAPAPATVAPAPATVAPAPATVAPAPAPAPAPATSAGRRSPAGAPAPPVVGAPSPVARVASPARSRDIAPIRKARVARTNKRAGRGSALRREPRRDRLPAGSDLGNDTPRRHHKLLLRATVALFTTAGIFVVALVAPTPIRNLRRADTPLEFHLPTSSPPAFAIPTGVALRDHGDSITVTWTDPGDGSAVAVVSMSRNGTPIGTAVTLPRKSTSYTAMRLDRMSEYCFLITLLPPGATSARPTSVCTTREQATTTSATAPNR